MSRTSHFEQTLEIKSDTNIDLGEGFSYEVNDNYQKIRELIFDKIKVLSIPRNGALIKDYATIKHEIKSSQIYKSFVSEMEKEFEIHINHLTEFPNSVEAKNDNSAIVSIDWNDLFYPESTWTLSMKFVSKVYEVIESNRDASNNFTTYGLSVISGQSKIFYESYDDSVSEIKHNDY